MGVNLWQLNQGNEMLWLLIFLLIFWKPIYWLGMYVYWHNKKDEHNTMEYITKLKSWFGGLWSLLKP